VNIVNPESMALTLDSLNEVFFFAKKLAKAEKEPAAKWIAGRQGLRFSYAEMPAPTDTERIEEMRVFTGEPVKSGASASHIIGEEACRALILLDVSNLYVENALKKATHGMMKRLLLPTGEPNPATFGMYCCGLCTCAYWRHLAVGGLRDSKKRLAAGIEILKEHRKGNGQWRVFPFYYTLLALSEMKLPSAVEEMRYAAPVLQRYVKRRASEDIYDQRRHALAERILESL
jgi:hypothetical protein